MVQKVEIFLVFNASNDHASVTEFREIVVKLVVLLVLKLFKYQIPV